MRAVDTNLLVRLLTRDDARQAAAADAFVASGAWISHLVLVEAIRVLGSVYGRGAAALAASVRMLLEHDSLVVEGADAVEAALGHFVARPTLGFSDCLILEVARRAGHVPLGTFARALAKLADAQKV